MGMVKVARRLRSFAVPDLPSRLARERQGISGRTQEQLGRLGQREGQGRRKKSGPPPPRPSGCPPRLPPARRSRRGISKRRRGWWWWWRRRRRGRSRLQEPLETESPAAAAGQRTGRPVSTEQQTQIHSPT
ncbi:guanine nucleotide-binding protein G(I)/G(S)/G(O) subunit gamma-12 isoform 2-T3 [Rhynchonycteris naso]